MFNGTSSAADCRRHADTDTDTARTHTDSGSNKAGTDTVETDKEDTDQILADLQGTASRDSAHAEQGGQEDKSTATAPQYPLAILQVHTSNFKIYCVRLSG